MTRAGRRRAQRLDVLSLLFAPLGVAVVLVAQYIDGSPLSGLVQGSSALVVGGGTLAAILLSYTPGDIARALRAAAGAFRRPERDLHLLAADVVSLSIRAHRRGIVTLDKELDDIADPFLRDGTALVVDGTDAQTLREVLAAEKSALDARDEAPARIFEAAAGYAPTMGILGAVLGLMRVMERLETPGQLGGGIALAFVATVYGVGSANLVLLPMAGRLREQAAERATRRELMIVGLEALHQRLNPRLVAHKLRVYSDRLPRIEELTAHMPVAPPQSPRIPA